MSDRGYRGGKKGHKFSNRDHRDQRRPPKASQVDKNNDDANNVRRTIILANPDRDKISAEFPALQSNAAGADS